MTTTGLPEEIRATIAPRVADGVLYLDHHRPGWAFLVDLATLDLASPCLCVLGQVTGLQHVADLNLYGVWDAACRSVGIDHPGGQDGELGLNSLAEDILDLDCQDLDDAAQLAALVPAELAALQESWVEIIATRQAAAGLRHGLTLAEKLAAR